MRVMKRTPWRFRLPRILCKRKPAKPPLSATESQHELGQEVKVLPLLDFPNEILLLIAENFENPLYIYRLMQTCHHLAWLLTPLLHKYAVLDREGIPALHWAARKGYEGLVQLLLQKGVDVDLPDPNHRGWTALHLAARDHESVVRVLLERGADVSIRDRFDETPLHRAVRRPNNEGIVRLLLEAGADVQEPDFLGNTPLHKAVKHDGPYPAAVVQQLLDMGADVSLKNGDGETALHEVVKHESSSGSLMRLLEKGDSMDDVDNYGRTALHHAAEKRSNHFLSAIRSSSVGYKLNVNIQDKNGATPLHIAAANANANWVEALLKRGADLSIKDSRGRTARDLGLQLGEMREHPPNWLTPFSYFDTVRALERGGMAHSDWSTIIAAPSYVRF